MKRVLQTEKRTWVRAGILLMVSTAGCADDPEPQTTITQTAIETIVVRPEPNNYGGATCPSGKPDYGSHYGGASSC